MKKISKIICMLFMIVMAVFFFGFIKDLDKALDLKNILVFLSDNKSSLSLMAQKVILTLYLLVMLCIPICITESKSLPYLYCMIVLVGTIVGKFTFWGYLYVVLSFPALIAGALAEGLAWIIRLFFSGFSGVWVECIFQIIGHLLMIALLTSPLKVLDAMLEQDSSSKSSNGGYSTSGTRKSFLEEMADGLEEVRLEIREEEKLETLKDIERHLRNK